MLTFANSVPINQCAVYGLTNVYPPKSQWFTEFWLIRQLFITIDYFVRDSFLIQYHLAMVLTLSCPCPNANCD